jgi:hypothetical protein
MRWTWQDVDGLPSDVYHALGDWLARDEGREEVIDMDALSDE